MARKKNAESTSAEVREPEVAPAGVLDQEAVAEPETAAETEKTPAKTAKKPAGASERVTATVTRMCNTRAKAELTSGITGVLGIGQKVEIVETADGWAKVVTGWVKAENLSV